MKEYDTNDYEIAVLDKGEKNPETFLINNKRIFIEFANINGIWVTPAKLRQVAKRLLRIAEHAEGEQ